MISNNEIKKVRSLHQKKYRDESGLFIVEGEKMVEEALNSTFQVEKVYYRTEIGDEAMQKISALSNPSPALAVVRKPQDVYSFDPGQVKKPGLYLGLDSMRDPGNLGTVIRIADWFGIDAIYASRDTVEVFNPKVVQATMGAVFRVKIYYVDLPEVSSLMLRNGGKVYGTFLDGTDMYRKDLDTGSQAPVMIVIGNESEGISEQMEALVSDKLFIPPYPKTSSGSESLNAAVATAITVAEFRRR